MLNLKEYNRVQIEAMKEFIKLRGGNPEVDDQRTRDISMLWYDEGWNIKFRETWERKEVLVGK